MERKYLTVLGIAVVAAILLSAAGIGYAAYMGNTYSEHNTMDVDKHTIDLYQGTTRIETPMGMPEFVSAGTVEISGYRVATSGPGEFRLQCQMANNAAWALIQSMTFTINDGAHPEPYRFGIDRTQSPVVTGLRTGTIEMDPDATFVSEGKTLLYYDFTISITFTDVDVTSDPNWQELSSFKDTKFVFYFTPADS